MKFLNLHFLGTYSLGEKQVLEEKYPKKSIIVLYLYSEVQSM